MAWLAKNALGGLFLPPCNLLLVQLAGLALWRKKPRLSRALVVASCAGLAFCSMPATAVILVEAVEGDVVPLHLEDPGLVSQADAIVVLGGGRIVHSQEYGGQDAISPASMMRLKYGMDLRHRTGKPLLLTGGSPGQRGRSEAALMAAAVVDEFGDKAEWVEERANNTAENAEFSRTLLAARGIKRVFLVTNAWHMPRAARAFRSVGLTVVQAPMGYLSDLGGGGSVLGWIPSSAGLEMSYMAMHEGIGAIWYRLRGVD